MNIWWDGLDRFFQFTQVQVINISYELYGTVFVASVEAIEKREIGFAIKTWWLFISTKSIY